MTNLRKDFAALKIASETRKVGPGRWEVGICPAWRSSWKWKTFEARSKVGAANLAPAVFAELLHEELAALADDRAIVEDRVREVRYAMIGVEPRKPRDEAVAGSTTVPGEVSR